MRNLTFPVAVMLLVASAIGTALPLLAQSRPAGSLASVPPASVTKVPLMVGLVSVGAVFEPDQGDYESILTVTAMSPESVSFTMSAEIDGRRVNVKRKIRRQDMAHGREWRPRYSEGDKENYPGSTSATLSADVLNELKTKGEASLNASIAAAFGFLNVEAEPVEGTIKRVERQPVPVSVIVNDVRVNLPAIHARGDLDEEPFEVYILDDPSNPMLLRVSLGDTNKRIVRISYPTGSPSSRIEEKLSKTGRAEVYGIYFDFAKATIKPESEPVLKEIADVMKKNPTWKLSVEGHTDNIGRAEANQELSARRATAVKQALVDRYKVAGGRLAPAGFGASRPKETNATLEGRARNRRVELARQPG
ncbi:MAG TPA: OmpA family protein [Thermoanaerobaculia bacterium]|nr:OmpA family protein [Thermoanaerobaculia bacterium]